MPFHAPTPALGGARGPDASNTAAELDHTRNELLLVATRDVRCASSSSSLVYGKEIQHNCVMLIPVSIKQL